MEPATDPTVVSPEAQLPRFSVVDIETSGLSVRRHRILQVAIVTVDNGNVIDEWSSYARIKPWQRVGPRRVHGIDRRTLRGAPDRRTVLTELATRIQDTVFTAHNVAFDWTFIERAARHDDVELPTIPRLCTLRLSRRLDPDRAMSHRLVDVCNRYEVRNAQPHDALHDARSTAAVLPRLLEAHAVVQSSDLAPLYERR
jgi:DNA polymerase III subunit epsilon